jgi:hypothetical protein
MKQLPFWTNLLEIESNAGSLAKMYSIIHEQLTMDDGSFSEFKSVDELAEWFAVSTEFGICELTDAINNLIES